MAPESDDQKAGDEEERRTGRDRRRPPLTIDLTAAPAAGKGGGAGASNAPPPPGSRPASAGPLSPAGLWAALYGWLPREGDRERWIGLGGAAVAGGLVAIILFVLLQAIGLVPSPGASLAREASDRARAVADSLAAIDRRVTTIGAMTDGLPGLRSDVAAAGGRVAALEQGARAAATKADIDVLRSDVAALRARVEQAPSSATATDLNALAARIARVEAGAVNAAGGGSGATALPAAPASPDVDARLAALASRLDAVETTLGRLSASQTAPGASIAAARTAAFEGLRRAVDAGRPFAVELDVVAAFGPDPAVAGLRPYAVSGIATREALRVDFGKVGDSILAATENTDDSVLGRLMAGAKGLVSVRPAGPIAGSDPTAVVSRIEAAVARGDLATALRERDALPQRGKDVSADWAARATARAAADGLFAPAVTGATGKG